MRRIRNSIRGSSTRPPMTSALRTFPACDSIDQGMSGEQARFSPANIVPGISWSPETMLQPPLFPYDDAQRHRLGVNFNHIPVNLPKCPHSDHRDGKMCTDGNLGRTSSLNPNSDGLWTISPISPSRHCHSRARWRIGTEKITSVAFAM